MIFQCNIQIFQAFVFLCISTMFACSIVQEFFTIWWKPFVCQVSVCASRRRGQKVVPLIICPLTSLSPHNFCPHTPAHIDSKAIAIDLINYVVLFFSPNNEGKSPLKTDCHFCQYPLRSLQVVFWVKLLLLGWVKISTLLVRLYLY